MELPAKTTAGNGATATGATGADQLLSVNVMLLDEDTKGGACVKDKSKNDDGDNDEDDNDEHIGSVKNIAADNAEEQDDDDENTFYEANCDVNLFSTFEHILTKDKEQLQKDRCNDALLIQTQKPAMPDVCEFANAQNNNEEREQQGSPSECAVMECSMSMAKMPHAIF